MVVQNSLQTISEDEVVLCKWAHVLYMLDVIHDFPLKRPVILVLFGNDPYLQTFCSPLKLDISEGENTRFQVLRL